MQMIEMGAGSKARIGMDCVMWARPQQALAGALELQIREACLLANEWNLELSLSPSADLRLAEAQFQRLQQMLEDLAKSLRACEQSVPGLWQDLAELETLVLGFRLSIEYQGLARAA